MAKSSARTQISRKAVTIQDVARAAEVSTATVSRALSNPELLSEQTRIAVLEAVKDTGYRVNLAARNLRMKRAGAVLVLVPDLGKPFYSRLLAGISGGFADSEYAVLIADTENRPLDEGQLAGFFLDGRIDGVISLDGSVDRSALDACVEVGVGERIVFLCEWVEDAGFPVISSDNVEGARLAIRHLFDLGHRRIAHVTGPVGNVLTTARRQGMIEERSRLGLAARDEWIIRGDFSLQSGYEAAQKIFGMKERPSAVFCAADMVAFGLISGLAENGLSVPRDISVVGFDDIEMSQFYVPSITTIRQDRYRLGQTAARALRDQLGTTKTGSQAGGEVLDVELVVRNSTAPPANM